MYDEFSCEEGQGCVECCIDDLVSPQHQVNIPVVNPTARVTRRNYDNTAPGKQKITTRKRMNELNGAWKRNWA